MEQVVKKLKFQTKEQWEIVADFTKFNRNGVNARKILKELHKRTPLRGYV